ncbi:Translation initiation factor eIF-2B subunit alpha [Coccomyxa sp. Obi]|nr:Translation initiation factor eIF-2B subunit alpha [Coccomyxa sp. Obi]
MNKRSISGYLERDEEGGTRLKTRDKPKLPLPQPPVPNPLVHREPKVRFSIADDSSQPIQHSGGSAYSLPGGSSGTEMVVRKFHDALARSPDTAVAVAAIKALTTVIERSTATTMMGLEKELKDAASSLERCNETAISLKAGCQLFLRYITRTSALEMENFEAAKARIIERGNYFAETSVRARATIAELGARFIRPGSILLVHGHSRVVLALLRKAVAQGIQFSVVITEGRPDETGLTMAQALDNMRVPTIAILDCAVAFALEAFRVDMVLVGAEGVVENGGVINKLGTFQAALAASCHNIPFYVAAESYKFARLYPLGQRDLPIERKHVDFGPLMPRNTHIENPSRDYTPPKYISLLFTDLGVLTPAAVSDELIQLYV